MAKVHGGTPSGRRVADLEIAGLRRRDRSEKAAVRLEVKERCPIQTVEAADQHKIALDCD